METYQYHPMHMHIHSCFQPGASMAVQMHNAAALGMRYIWFTDHDTRTGVKQRPVNGFSFDTPELSKTRDGKPDHGFEQAHFEKEAALTWSVKTENKTLTLQAEADSGEQWQSAGISFFSSARRHTAALLMGITLWLKLQVSEMNPDCRLILDVRLSQRPPECKPAHMYYVLGDAEGLAQPDIQILPLTIKDGTVVLPLSADVSNEDSIGGLDNVFDTLIVTLQVRKSAKMQVMLEDFQIRVEKFFEQAHQAQKEVAALVGKRYGVTPFVSFEISAVEHKNCFSTHVPTIDYREYDYRITEEQAGQYVLRHGGIFAINHPLALNVLKRKVFTPQEQLNVIDKMAAELLKCRAYGASLMEVGYPMGRNNFSLEQYLLLWDKLTLEGLFLCGYGCSDSHRNNDGWFDGNNFATWLGVDAGLQHPIAEAAFVQAMKQGNAYMGDPVKLKGSVSFATAQGHPQGSVFDRKETDVLELCFHAENTQPGWSFRLIENGQEIFRQTVSENSFDHNSLLRAGTEKVCFQRAMLYDENGRCVLLTNPVCIADMDALLYPVPQERRKKL